MIKRSTSTKRQPQKALEPFPGDEDKTPPSPLLVLGTQSGKQQDKYYRTSTPMPVNPAQFTRPIHKRDRYRLSYTAEEPHA